MLKRTAPVSDEDMMRRCFALAEQSAKQGEYPYAAVIVRNGIIVAETTNRVARDRDVTRHAELVAICRAQETLASTDLSDCTIYANMEPCVFCSYAIRESRDRPGGLFLALAGHGRHGTLEYLGRPRAVGHDAGSVRAAACRCAGISVRGSGRSAGAQRAAGLELHAVARLGSDDRRRMPASIPRARCGAPTDLAA